MGQKVNPHGMRVGVIKDWDSRWFTSKQAFGDTLVEDYKIRKTLLMATLVTPKLLLLDEHTAALDPATAEKVLDLTKSIVAEKKITCLMVTHNMHQALELGNRTLMMDAGRIVFDVKGEARGKMTVDDLLEKFRENAGKALDNDRILLSKVEANR